VHLYAGRQLLADLVERSVVLLLHHGAHLLHSGLVEFRLRPPSVRTRRDAARLTLQVEIVLHGLRVDCEPLRQLPHAPLEPSVSIDDALHQVIAVRSHRAGHGARTVPAYAIEQAQLVVNPPENRSRGSSLTDVAKSKLDKS